MNQNRLERVIANMNEQDLEQLLICDPFSIKWLTGYFTEPFERFLALLIKDDGSSVLFANRLFPEPFGAAEQIEVFSDTDDPLALVARYTNPQTRLGVDKEITARWLIPLMREKQAASDYVLGSPVIDKARSLKDATEIELMRKASQINDQAMEWLIQQVHEGVTEREIADRLEGHYRELGAAGNSFTPIVSFGANAADPHHEPDDSVVQPGDVVLFDVGCVYEGYCSDMTRSFFYGEPTEHQCAVYECVRAANEAAEAFVAPGILFSEIDAAARNLITEAGWGEFFTHRLGHQIGTQVHEPGDVSATHHEPVEPGMCFSIEPGIYLPHDVGVRIEDLVVVTEDGREVLNHYPHDLQVL